MSSDGAFFVQCNYVLPQTDPFSPFLFPYRAGKSSSSRL